MFDKTYSIEYRLQLKLEDEFVFACLQNKKTFVEFIRSISLHILLADSCCAISSRNVDEPYQFNGRFIFRWIARDVRFQHLRFVASDVHERQVHDHQHLIYEECFNAAYE